MLLWVIGIPLLILLFALAALGRGLLHAGQASAARAPDAAPSDATPGPTPDATPAAPTGSRPRHSVDL